jgi:hypothetical protein
MTYGVNAPIGMSPHSFLNGALWTGQLSNYFILSGYNAGGNGGLFLNDPIVPLADGSIGLATAGSNPVIGSFQGCFYIDASGNAQFSKYWPNAATTQGTARALGYVADTVNLLYDIQYTATPGLDFTALNSNAILVAGNGSTTTGYSGWSFGTIASGGGSEANQLKVIRLTPYIGNLFNSQGPGGVFPYNNFLCLINNDPYKGGTGTAGI